MNVRCPSCGAVFPAGSAGASGDAQAECPLCLDVFDSAAHVTGATVEDSPDNQPTAALPDDDEFESFGATSVVAGGAASKRSVVATAAASRSAAAQAAPVVDGSADVDFDSLLGDFGGGTSAAFDSGPVDPFASTGLGASDDGREGDSLFGDAFDATADSAPRPDPGARGLEDDSLFLATPNTSGAAFDDAAIDDDDFSVPVRPGRSSDRPAEATRRPDAAKRGKKKAKKGRRRKGSDGDDARAAFDPQQLIDRLLSVVLVVLILGLALDEADMGLFGSKVLAGLGFDVSALLDERPPPQKARPKLPDNLYAAVEATGSLAADLQEIERVARLMEQDADNKAHAVLLLALYDDLMLTEPVVYQGDPIHATRGEQAAGRLEGAPAGHKVVVAILEGDLDGHEAALPALLAGSPDDQLIAVTLRMRQVERATRRQALMEPGLTAKAEIDPTTVPRPADAQVIEARKWLDALLAKLPTDVRKPARFHLTDAALYRMQGEMEKMAEPLRKATETRPDDLGAQLLMAELLISRNKLGEADVVLDTVAAAGNVSKRRQIVVGAYRGKSQIAARRAHVGDQIRTLQALAKLTPDDELIMVRLGRLLMNERRSEEAQLVLIEGQRREMTSIAFEVVLVEYWLFANRIEDALAEVKRASIGHPDSVDLLFLHGQIEEQHKRLATARDLYARVLEREPRHMRAVLRLASLQSDAGRHDESLATLQAASGRMGEVESLLAPTAHELMALDRLAEARSVLDKLLELQPRNRDYLLNAARLDLGAEKTDKALGYLRTLRADGALDRDAAVQLAQALNAKGQIAEAAKTILPFAEQNPNDVELNTLAGHYLIDSGDLVRAETVLKRAYAIAHRLGGKYPEPLFQYGRLAFLQGELQQGITLINQAIELAPGEHRYRFVMADSLLHVGDNKAATERGVRELRILVANAPRYAEAGKPIKNLDEVHRLLANHFYERRDYGRSIEHLRVILESSPDDKQARHRLGLSLFATGDKEAEAELRRVLKGDPKDAEAALHLGLVLLGTGHSSDAMHWFEQALRANTPDVAQAAYHVALIYKERGQSPAAMRSLRRYLKLAPPDGLYRQEAQDMLKDLR